ncbi:trigger factor [Verminephrobacter aporrectodeae]|uniref:Trigger factor n=1 Tax=Verminephrobacter aporrectodeae subsp. tuberculatae TaxID=1110392 RepID=A0ABT3KRJ5_9BURK|nr:trigger factor [Verminephrobacter aporrectodeae]MCW5220099.1 trigger factor [Verminephrobacter aporrectodeae subsp. tuberculatae]MCW5255936.1 trigger factor [Verminephrobacter aporrectodeae subsp. tuberculatae]MCW5289387.1 trigger factor [Verminephrobacter aporrectodeae subsp. tuberculatae]MCW5320948.1 trigger factor [Verminephrobacter aporrectodeae subsp. tuberculatae]MCW8164541.1 trigger factor [Verminephrobacter aporrectodeae subsp. tuberculatae]
MAVTVETLDKLERKMTLSLSRTLIQTEVDTRLKRLARTVRMDGFRPGKVPMSVVAQRYGISVHSEVLGDKVREAFSVAANEANLRIAGHLRISEKEGAPEDEVTFDAFFEVFPEVRIADLADAQIEKLSADVPDAAIDKTIEVLRKLRRSFAQRALDAAAQDGDRVTVDFQGKIDGEPFEGGKAEDFQFLIGESRMSKEFEDAVRGMKSGESRTFPQTFPADYRGQDVAGKTADFLVTVKKIESVHQPEVNEALIKSLGVADGSMEGLRANVRKNLEREVKLRLQVRNRQAVMEALLVRAELDLPTASVQAEIARLQETAQAEFRQRTGIRIMEKTAFPETLFRSQAERGVRLSLIVAELARVNGLHPGPEQLRAVVEELAASYEKPEEVVRWHLDDRQRLANLAALVTENNVAEFVFTKAQVVEKAIAFDELMAQKG